MEWERERRQWASEGGLRVITDDVRDAVWCGPIKPQDTTVVNRERWKGSQYGGCVVSQRTVCICESRPFLWTALCVSVIEKAVASVYTFITALAFICSSNKYRGGNTAPPPWLSHIKHDSCKVPRVQYAMFQSSFLRSDLSTVAQRLKGPHYLCISARDEWAHRKNKLVISLNESGIPCNRTPATKTFFATNLQHSTSAVAIVVLCEWIMHVFQSWLS